LDGFDSILGRESSHNERQLPVGSGLDGSQVNPLHVLRGVSAAAIYFHYKFGVPHSFIPFLFCAEKLLYRDGLAVGRSCRKFQPRTDIAIPERTILNLPLSMKPTTNRSAKVIGLRITADKSTLIAIEWKPVSH
jgi:hypothetical protein